MNDATHKGDVLLIGRLSNESITTSVKSMGSSYVQKMLTSGPNNWKQIISLIEQASRRFSCVLVKLTEGDLDQSILPAFSDLFQRICELVSAYPHAIFLYTDLLTDFPVIDEAGRIEWQKRRELSKNSQARLFHTAPPHLWAWMYENRNYEEYVQELARRVAQLKSSGLNLVPYRTLVELNVSAQSLIEQAFRGLLMRIYIPNDRLWAGEIDKLLTLFADYLRRVEDHPVTLDQSRTEKGLIYGFYSSDNTLTKEQLSSLLEDFSLFLKVCADDPKKASELIKKADLSSEQLHSILTKYSKEARRLLLDIQYEKESKMLAIRHRLQSELLDSMSTNEARNTLALIDRSRETKIDNPLDIINTTGVAGRGETIIQSQTIHINNPQFIAQARGIIAREINGSIEYTEQDEQLLELFKQHASEVENVELKSSLDELKDKSVPHPQRTTAWQKVQGFLSKHSEAIGKTGLSILEKYIEHLLTGK